jgi:hypothetical protein
VAALEKLAPPVRRALWRQALEDMGPKGARASARHVAALEELLAGGSDAARVALPGARHAQKRGKSIVLA